MLATRIRNQEYVAMKEKEIKSVTKKGEEKCYNERTTSRRKERTEKTHPPKKGDGARHE